jgi:adenylosuccinate synthase
MVTSTWTILLNSAASMSMWMSLALRPNMAGLPMNARRYLERLGEVAGVPIDMVSTGPDRLDTIVLRDPLTV